MATTEVQLLRSKLTLLAVLLVLLAGCSIQERGEGDRKDVKIATPFGGMEIKADDKNPADTGLAVYPGSTLKAKEGDESSTANVSISSGIFGLRVAAATYTSGDSLSKVRDFYKQELNKYGSVIECRGKIEDRDHDQDDELFCKEGAGEAGRVELGVGNKQRRRIVSLKPNDKGTEFSLVYLQLRGKEGAL